MIYIGECKNSILVSQEKILEAIFHKETDQDRFGRNIENKSVLSFWLSQMLNTSKRLQEDNFANWTIHKTCAFNN